MNNNTVQTSETGQVGLSDSQKLDFLMDRMERVEKGVKKINRYFFWTGIITLLTIVLPVIVLIVAFPWMMSTLSSSVGGGDTGNLLETFNQAMELMQ